MTIKDKGGNMDERRHAVERFCYSLSPEQKDDLRSILNITISDSLISCLGDAKIVSDIELQKNKNYDETTANAKGGS